MSAHLLSLSALHIAAPGVLDAVFGKDGKHEDAPYWTGPVIDVHPGGHRGFFHVTKILSGRFVDVLEIAPMMDLHDLALDLRIPTVAARLAGLCARAMGARPLSQPRHGADLPLDPRRLAGSQRRQPDVDRRRDP